MLLAAAAGLLRTACGTQDSAAGFDAPCERNGDCARGLSCDAGVCISSATDASDGGAGAPDAGIGDGSAAND